MNPDVSGVFKLGIAEKLQLVEDLWDDIASAPERVPVPDWQKEELARRKSEYLRNPRSGIPWEEAKERIPNQHG